MYSRSIENDRDYMSDIHESGGVWYFFLNFLDWLHSFVLTLRTFPRVLNHSQFPADCLSLPL